MEGKYQDRHDAESRSTWGPMVPITLQRRHQLEGTQRVKGQVQTRIKLRYVSYGHPWAHYSGGY
jgi:hypothetical protein